MWRVSALVILLLPLAGCLSVGSGPDPPQAVGAPATTQGTIVESQPKEIAEPLRSGLRPTVRSIGPGSVDLMGLPTEAALDLVADGAVVQSSLFADREGNLRIEWLQPGTGYEMLLGDVSVLGFQTEALGWSWAEDPLIQPGKTQAIPCTLGLILRDSLFENLYGLAAGHCMEKLGAEVRVRIGNAESGTPVGTVVATERSSAAENGSVDFAIFSIDPAFYPRIQPQVFQVGGPTSIGAEGAPRKGDQMCWYGYGSAYGDGGLLGLPMGPSARCGEYSHLEAPPHGNATFWASGHVYNGDSGSAVVDAGGAWHGMVVVGLEFDSYEAVTACNALDAARRHGFELAPVYAPSLSEQAPLHPPAVGVGATVLGHLPGSPPETVCQWLVR